MERGGSRVVVRVHLTGSRKRKLALIDLRSDTVTRPTPEMRDAMARAEVGDDVYGDDPTVRRLEERTAELLGKEDAVFMPTGTMTNQVALRTHTEASDEVLADAGAHILRSEGGAPAALSGVQVRTLPGVRGIFTAEDVDKAVYQPHAFNPKTIGAPTKLLCFENTHNGGGGTVWPLQSMQDAAEAGRRLGLATHMDGARLWNAAIASGVSELAYASLVDSVSVCFSKGLGAPVGSALAGPRAFTERARRFKQLFGGGFRQAGVLAAAALHAVEHHRADLANDHLRASRLAEGLSELDGIEIDREAVQTNIVRFRLTRVPAGVFVEQCHASGVYMLPAGRHAVRAVLHRDVADTDVEEALAVTGQVLAGVEV
jgi:threonine aldolase